MMVRGDARVHANLPYRMIRETGEGGGREKEREERCRMITERGRERQERGQREMPGYM